MTGIRLDIRGLTVLAVETFEIRDVLGSTRGPLVGPELLEANEWEKHAGDRHFDPVRIASIEVHAAQAREQIDPRRRVAELHDSIGLEKVLALQSEAAETEAGKRLKQSINVCGSRPDPDVQVTGVARMSMRGERVPATTRYSTPVEPSNSTNSLKSLFSIRAPRDGLLAQLLDGGKTLLGGA
jgi:hypothetical protein